MKTPRINPRSWLVVAVLSASLNAATPAPAPTGANLPPPALPGTGSPGARVNPVAEFRALLSMGPEEEGAALAGRSETHRRFLQTKLREYRALSEAEREARLSASENRWRLGILLTSTPEERPRLLKELAPTDQPNVLRALEQWEMLPKDLQADLLSNEVAFQSFFKTAVTATAAPAPSVRPPGAGSAEQQRLEQEIARWKQIPPQRRARLVESLQRWFTLQPSEREQALSRVPEAERATLERVLDSFGRLTAAERKACLDALAELASLPETERRSFLSSAERWFSMTTQEKAAWSRVANRLPPSPAGLRATNASR